jgi:hypothetical protein
MTVKIALQSWYIQCYRSADPLPAGTHLVTLVQATEKLVRRTLCY